MPHLSFDSLALIAAFVLGATFARAGEPEGGV